MIFVQTNLTEKVLNLAFERINTDCEIGPSKGWHDIWLMKNRLGLGNFSIYSESKIEHIVIKISLWLSWLFVILMSIRMYVPIHA